MYHNTGLNNRLNHLHERDLKFVYQEKKSNFKTLLENDKSVTIHLKHLHYLVTETDLSMNILCAGNKSPVQRCFFKNGGRLIACRAV